MANATAHREQKSVKEPPFLGIPTTADGSNAVVWVETHITQGAAAYPITPSTSMGVEYQAEVANGRKNLWGETLVFIEPESEHSSATAAEGFAVAGGRVANFTCSQGLILMKEVLYVISGKRLPVVFHIAARALASQAVNMHAGHDDVMGVADCGWGMLFARNAQEAGDLALIARRAAEDSETPFLNVQDGFLTTHTIEGVRLPEPELMRQFAGEPSKKLRSLMDVHRPLQSGGVQYPEGYMKGRIAQRIFAERARIALERAMAEFSERTGRRYGLVSSYRLEDAAYALVGMGSLMETAQATVDYLRGQGIPVGVLYVTSFRPFPGREIVEALRHCRAVAVIERTDEPLAEANPLAREIQAAFAEAASGSPRYPAVERLPQFFQAAAGLGGRDVRPGDFLALVENLRQPDGKRSVVLGISGPGALERTSDPDVRPVGAFSLRGHSIGGFGSVTTNKIIATLAADLFGMSVQAYAMYGAEKKGLPTSYYLTLAPEHIRTHCELAQVEMVVVQDANAFRTGNPFQGLRSGGVLFIQTAEPDAERVWAAIPPPARAWIAENRVRVFYLDSAAIAREVAATPDLILRMQGIVLLGVFLRVTPFQTQLGESDDQLFQKVQTALERYFGKRGARVVESNLLAVRRGFSEVREVPPERMLLPNVERHPLLANG